MAFSDSDPGVPLRVLAERRGIRIGAAVNEGPLQDDPLYREILSREFNIVTCENAMKFGSLRPACDRFAFENADTIVAFARQYAMAVRGHTLLWHQMIPGWLTEGRFSFDDGIDVLRGHIETVTRRYRGQVTAWDVVNEAIDENGGGRDSLFSRAFGPDYVTMAFHWAHEGDPDAKLFYNDFSAEGLNRKSNAVYTLMKDLLSQGVPVHGVGLQMHVHVWDPPKSRDVADNIRRLNDLGLEVHVTEMDVQIKEPITEEALQAQARVYRDILDVCLAAANCKALLTWGVTDRYSWVPAFFPGYGAALLFDADGHPKPAYHAVHGALE
jgi:endo-1,4-beta-xylanase